MGRKFIERACERCHDISCGCPVYIGFHFYAFDCQPEATGGYAGFSQKLQEVADVMDAYPFIKGAIINEVGMLNCGWTPEEPICVPDSGKYPASSAPDHGCPVNEELPNGLASFMDKLFDLMLAAKTRNGRPVVKGFSWFNENGAGGTYNLEIPPGWASQRVGRGLHSWVLQVGGRTGRLVCASRCMMAIHGKTMVACEPCSWLPCRASEIN